MMWRCDAYEWYRPERVSVVSRRQRLWLDRERAGRSRCSTPSRRRAATSSTPPMSTRRGFRVTSAANRRRSSADWMTSAPESPPDGDRDEGRMAPGLNGLAPAERSACGAEASLTAACRPHRPLLRAPRRPGHAARGPLRAFTRWSPRARCGTSRRPITPRRVWPKHSRSRSAKDLRATSRSSRTTTWCTGPSTKATSRSVRPRGVGLSSVLCVGEGISDRQISARRSASTVRGRPPLRRISTRAACAARRPGRDRRDSRHNRRGRIAGLAPGATDRRRANCQRPYGGTTGRVVAAPVLTLTGDEITHLNGMRAHA